MEDKITVSLTPTQMVIVETVLYEKATALWHIAQANERKGRQDLSEKVRLDGLTIDEIAERISLEVDKVFPRTYEEAV